MQRQYGGSRRHSKRKQPRHPIHGSSPTRFVSSQHLYGGIHAISSSHHSPSRPLSSSSSSSTSLSMGSSRRVMVRDHTSSHTHVGVSQKRHVTTSLSSSPASPPPGTSSQPPASPLEIYQKTVAEGNLSEDPRQLTTIQHLDRLWHDINALPDEVFHQMSRNADIPFLPRGGSSSSKSSSSSSSGLSSLWKSLKALKPSQHQLEESPSLVPSPSNNKPRRPHHLRGFYIYGGVGCGKTMMMDMFFDAVPPTKVKKVRKHFHSFMLDVHKHLHRLRQEAKEQGVSHTDPLIHIARQFVAREGHLLCLDEFQVTDVADAMILRELFSALFEHGCIVVSTSNRPPEDLYKNGINRELFLPFIDTLKENCEVIAMDHMQDYRLKVTMEEGVFHIPLNDQTAREMDTIYQRLAAGSPSQQHTLSVQMGRTLPIQQCVPKRVARFQFTDLCAKALGAADYMAIAKEFPCILVENIPVLYFDTNREMIRRFITMLDVFYEHRSKVFMSMDAHPSELFRASPSSSPPPSPESSTSIDPPTSNRVVIPGESKDEVFASARAVSRLIEMSSTTYLQGPLHTAGSKDTESH